MSLTELNTTSTSLFPEDILTSYLSSLWDKAEEEVMNPDILVNINGKKVGCNKMALGAFSQYFDESFASQKNLDIVEFDVPKKFVEVLGDRALRVFEKCLEWIHTGNVELVKKDAKEMYKASVLLKMPRLVQICRDLWPEP
ncbi:unnamed protein product [Gordionus sp. m RMFG-2023]